MVRRLLYAVFFICGGFLFAIPKWILTGTKGAAIASGCSSNNSRFSKRQPQRVGSSVIETLAL